MTKTTWTKPVLVVLEKGRPEESLVAACKGALAGVAALGFNTTPATAYGTCQYAPVAASVGCLACSNISES